MVKPFSPEEAIKGKLDIIPVPVIEAFNDMLCRKLDGGRACFRQSEILESIRQKMNLGRTSDGSPDVPLSWLNVENMYRDQGWEVDYDKPGYNEDYDAVFTFTIRPYHASFRKG